MLGTAFTIISSDKLNLNMHYFN